MNFNLSFMSRNLYFSPYSVSALFLSIFNNVSSCMSTKFMLSFSNFRVILIPMREKMKYSKCCRIMEPYVWSSEHLFRRILITSPNIENPVNPAAIPMYKVDFSAGILAQPFTLLHNLLKLHCKHCMRVEDWVPGKIRDRGGVGANRFYCHTMPVVFTTLLLCIRL